MKTMKSMLALLATVLCTSLPSPSAHALPFTYTFGLSPAGGTVSGAPGQLVGWGYTLANTDAVNWFVPTQLSASSFALGTPDAGYFDFPILAPGLAVSVAFNASTGQGLFGLQLHPGVLPGQGESGQFTLAGEWWSGDPLGGGMLLQPGNSALAPFTVQVTGGATPEPATLALLLGGLVWLIVRPPLTPLRRSRPLPLP
jgi:hypothetical protein